jgi:spore germination protein GerM
MKRITLILIIASILLCTGCSAQKEEFQSPVNFYYPRIECTFGKADSVLGAEIREAGDHKDDLNYLLQQYLTGPKTEALYSPFPAGTKLVRLEQNEETLNIILDSTFAELSGLKLTLACAGLTRTCLELAPVDTVQISADGPTLDGKRSIIMDRHALELIDRAVDNSTYPTEIQEAS